MGIEPFDASHIFEELGVEHIEASEDIGLIEELLEELGATDADEPSEAIDAQAGFGVLARVPMERVDQIGVARAEPRGDFLEGV